MRLFICSKEWLDDYAKEERELTHSISYATDSEFYYLEAISKKLSSNIIAVNKTKMEEAKLWQREHEKRVTAMKRMNIIQRLLYNKRRNYFPLYFFVLRTHLIMIGIQTITQIRRYNYESLYFRRNRGKNQGVQII